VARGDGLVLRDLRRARRRHHLQAVDIWDALYRVYITALFGSLGVAVVAGYVGRDPATAGTLDRVARQGPAVVGLGIAAIVGLGLRSGARGGPVAIAPADVQLVLLAPIPRERALLDPALRQLRFAVFAGAVLGALGGVVASRRLPGSWTAWLLWDAATGAATAVAAVGAALVVSGLRARRWASPVALALLLWTTGDLVWSTATSPTSRLGELALRPTGVDGVPWLGVAGAVVMAAAGLGLLGGTAITAAQQRAALIAQLRFAVTMQDVRTVVLLRRALAQDEPRARPWFRLPPAAGAGHAVWRRDTQGVLRWRAARFGRLALMAAVAGGALVGAWRGTTVLVVVAGAALFVAALDAAEGLGQEVDLPVRRDTLPVGRRWLTAQHMVVPVGAMAVAIAVGVAGVAGALAPSGRGGLALAVGIPTILAAAMGATCGAVLSVVSEPFDSLSPELLAVPELIASTRLLVRVCVAPALAVAGTLPVLAAQARGGTGPAAAAAAGTSAALVAAMVGMTVLSSR
jgi:hypothetical protein